MSAKACYAAHAARAAANMASYWDLLPKPKPTTLLLTRDEAVSLLHPRFPDAAKDFEQDRAGPAYVSWRGERRFDWWAAFYWARDYRSIRWDTQGDTEDDPPPEAAPSPSLATAEN